MCKRILSFALLLAAILLLCGCSKEGEQITSLSQLKKPGTIIINRGNPPEGGELICRFESTAFWENSVSGPG